VTSVILKFTWYDNLDVREARALRGVNAPPDFDRSTQPSEV